MNEQLEKALGTLIDKAMGGMEASVDFLSAEIPATIHQLIMWYAASSLVYAVCGLVILYFTYLMYKKPKVGKSNWMWEYCEHEKEHEYSEYAIFGIFLLFPTFAGVTMFIDHSLEALKIWIAPNIWLMEYAATLAK